MKGCIVAIFKLIGSVVGLIVGLTVAVSILSKGNSVSKSRQIEIHCEELSKTQSAAIERQQLYEGCVAGGKASLAAQERINREGDQSNALPQALVPQKIQVTVSPSPAAKVQSSFSIIGNEIIASETEHQPERNIVEKVFFDEIAMGKSMDSQPPVPITIATIDLNEDGKNEIIAEFGGNYFCGNHGCRVSILSSQPDGTWKEIGGVLGGIGALRVSSVQKNGYKVILFGENSELRFENGKYVQSMLSRKEF